MKRFTRIFCMLLAVCMVLAMLPASVQAQETETSDSTDFVLVLDCSGSLEGRDRELAISACKMFVDLIPVENARVSVITMGKSGTGEAVYTFSDGFLTEMKTMEENGTFDYPFGVETKENFQSLHPVVELGGAEDLAVRQSYKDQIASAAQRVGVQTPITHGLAAALDMLEQDGAQDGNACMILLTDGEMISGQANESAVLKDWVIENAKARDWPIYCIDTKFGQDIDQGLLNELSIGTGVANGKMKSVSAVELCGHFLEIFNHFMENKNGTQGTVTLKSGKAEHAFTVPVLSSETNVVVASSDPDKGLEINKVELYRAQGGKAVGEPIITVNSGDSNKEVSSPISVMGTVESGVYFCMKMINPAAGDYVLCAYGPADSDASILVYDSSLREMDLAMTTDPASSSNVVQLTRDQMVSVNAAFSYADYTVSSTDEVTKGYYEERTATLYAYDEYDNVIWYDVMGVGSNGYHYDLKLNETSIPSDKNFRLAVKVEDEMYRNGAKESNSAWFVAQNRLLEYTMDTHVIELNGHVAMKMDDEIILGNYYMEADGDAIDYTLKDFKQVRSGGSVSIDAFEYGMSEGTDAIWIKTGLIPGEYEATLTITEAGGGAPLTYTVRMHVENEPINYTEIPQIEVWTDYFPLFQKEPPMDATIALDDYFSDYEGVAIAYNVREQGEDALLDVALNGSEIYVEPIGDEEGMTSLVIEAYQSAEGQTTDSVEVTVQVAVKSGRAEFWRVNWIWFALAGALIVIIILIFAFLSMSTKVKGTWQITYEENGSVEVAGTVKISSALPCGRKKKFTLREMIDQVNRFAEEQGGVIANVPNYFMDNEIRNIELKGIPIGSIGFIIRNIPADKEKVTVDYLGRTANKKVRVTGGTVTITLSTPENYGVSDKLTITMTSMGR